MTGIIYVTKYGSTELSAIKLKSYLGDDVELINLKKKPQVNLDDYDTVIIGSPIFAGQINGKIATFCTDHQATLLKKKLGLYINCLERDEKALAELNNSYPQELLNHAVAKDYFGGNLVFEKMNPITKTFIKLLTKEKKSVFDIKEENIKKFSEQIK